MDNQIAIVKSTALLRRVVEKERLVDDPEFGSRSLQGTTPLGRRANLFFARAWAVKPYLTYADRAESAL